MPNDFLSNLPSVRELLDNPQIKVLYQKLGRSEVATGVRRYLQQVGDDLQQRLASSPLPSATEIAERAARFVLELNSSKSRRTVINATGRIFGPEWASIPISDTAQTAIIDVANGFVPCNSKDTQQAAPLHQAEKLLSQSTSAEAAMLVHSYESALWLLFEALSSIKNQFIVAQADLGHMGTTSVHELAGSTKAEMTSVGSANVVQLSDYQAALHQQVAAIIRLHWNSFGTVGFVNHASNAELAQLAHEHDVPFIEAIDTSPLSHESSNSSTTCAANCLAAGADIVVMRGAGQLGTVSCGVILGKQKWLEKLAGHPLTGGMLLEPLRAAAVAASLNEIAATSENLISCIPLQRLQQTPLENLRLRAQRMAEQISGAPGIQNAEAIKIEPTPETPLLDGRRSSSYGVAVSVDAVQQEPILERLQHATRPIRFQQHDSQWIFDLASVFPDEDQAIVATLAPSDDS